MIRWNPAKSELLKRVRGVSFGEILHAEFIGTLENTARKNQQLYLFRYKAYIWVVPYVMHGGEIFLKTLFPSRKYTKMYERGELP